MINIDFYKYVGEQNVLDKALSSPFTLIGMFYSDVDLIQPIIVIRNFDIKNYNYCYIEELGRYYFINKIVIENNKDNRVYLSLDVLNTYKELVKDATGTVNESSNANPYISTRSNVYDTRPNFKVLDFEKDHFTEEGKIIMITIKGSTNG